jgi:hypothetical protein
MAERPLYDDNSIFMFDRIFGKALDEESNIDNSMLSKNRSVYRKSSENVN